MNAKDILKGRIIDFLEEKNREDKAARARLESALQLANTFFTDFPLPVKAESGYGSVAFFVSNFHEDGDVRFCYNPEADRWWYTTPIKTSQNLKSLEDCFVDFTKTATDSTLKHISEILNERSR